MSQEDLVNRLDKNFSTKQLLTILNASISKKTYVAGDIVNFVNALDKLYPDIRLLQSYFYPRDKINELTRELELAGFVADTDCVSIDDEAIGVIYDNQGLHIMSFSREQVIRYIMSIAVDMGVYPANYSDEVEFLTILLEVVL